MTRRASILKTFVGFVAEANPSLSAAELQEVESELGQIVDQMPPIGIGLIGEAGVGKSSTINNLFSVDLEVGHAVAGTKEPRWLEIDLGDRGQVRVLDMPGLGESIEADERYREFYLSELPKLDVVVWVIAAEHRAMRPIQDALQMLARELGPQFTDRLLIAANKVDLIHPGPTDWSPQFNSPSKQQRDYLQQRLTEIEAAVRYVLPKWKNTTVAYSANRRWQLEHLLNAMLTAVPDERAWLLSKQAELTDFTELVDPRILEMIEARRARPS